MAIELQMSSRMDHGKESDRRSHQRFEVVGQLWGYFNTSDSLEVRDVNAGGALTVVESPPAEGSVHKVQVDASGHAGDLRMRVKHVRLDADPGRHLVGLECVDDNRAFWDKVVASLTGGTDGTRGGGGGSA